MRGYEILLPNGTLSNGKQLVKIEHNDVRPRESGPEGELMRDRKITPPENTPIKYCYWDGGLKTLSAEEREEVDVIMANRENELEVRRQASKSDELKEAENAFIVAVQTVNALLGIEIGLGDGFIEIGEKIESSTVDDITKVKASIKLRNVWDFVEKRGGAFGDISWHEVAI